MARDLPDADATAIVAARSDEPYGSVQDVRRRARVSRGALDRIGDADVFGSLGT